MTISANARHTLRYGLAATLLLSCAPAALHAETSDKDEKIRHLEQMMIQMQAQIRSLKTAVGEERVEGRKTREKVRVVVEKGGYALPPPGPAIPAGAVPAFVTADKKLQFGAITITPGGFVAMESVFRTRTEQADIGSAYNQIPLGGPQAATNELRFSPHQSRIAALIEAPITPSVLASGYGEFDFLASGATSNANESNSFVPRIRHLYGTLDFADYGFHVLGGQNWSLATLNSKGITPRNEVTPPTIDAQYVPGFVWKRQAQIRITKDFSQRLWMALSAEESQTTFNNCPNANVNAYGAVTTTTNTAGAFCNLFGQNNLYNAQSYSLNHVPDVIGKIAYEAKLADRDVHLEGFGMYRDFYDRVASTNSSSGVTFGSNNNHDTTGWGAGGGVVAAVLPRKLDFQASGLFGRGIGRYGTGQLSDVVVANDGSLKAIPEGMLLGGFTAHVTPSIDIYTFAGIERELRTVEQNSTGTYSGLGNGTGGAAATVAGCNAEANTLTNTPLAGSICNSTANGNNKQLFQLTAGFWDKIYKGSFGEVRVGAQYQFNERQVFNNPYLVNATTGVAINGTNNYQPKAFDHVVMTSLRYYPFQ